MGGALQAAQGRLGMKLRRTRKKLGMTQAAVGRAVGMNQTTISSVERGLGDPGSRNKVSKWLGDPETTVEHISDTLLEAAAATGDPAKRRKLVRAWVNLYGEDGEDE